VSPAYNPIVRNFCRLRAVLVDALGVDRCAVRPATPLAELIPADEIGEVLGRLRAAGFSAPRSEYNVTQYPFWFVGVAGVGLFVAALLLRPLLAIDVGLLAVRLVTFAVRARRHRTVTVPLGPRTVGDLVMYVTRFGDHPGYRFTRAEVSLKVRLIVAESLALPVEQVREDTTFTDLEHG
jgi:hypothetical protein